MRPVLVAAAVAALLLPAGCDRTEAPRPAGPTRVPAARTPAAPPGSSPAGGIAASAGSSLGFIDIAGERAATLSCGPGGLRLVVPGFRPIASEDRLSLGTEGAAFALVADLAAPGPGVTASGSADPDLLDRLARGEALFASYGQQSAGPLTVASTSGLQALISACRRRV